MNSVSILMNSRAARSPTRQPQTESLAEPQPLTGAAHKRFVIAATLLYLIDPVRGEPTVHSLDIHPHDGSWRQENLKKKFLDSFALICSTSRVGGDTASAVCLEEGHPAGNVLRLARNLGVPPELVDDVHQILGCLAAVAAREKNVRDGENELLLKIISLTEDKIRSLLEKLCKPENQRIARQAIATLEEDDPSLEDSKETLFRQWITNLPDLLSLPPSCTPTQLMPHIKWAAEAKWIHAEQMEAMFCPNGDELPLWIKHLYKLGRYHSAAKAMLKLSVKQPDLFASIHVDAVEAPKQQRFSLNDKSALGTALRKWTGSDPTPLLKRLGQSWLTDDPEARLRKACRHVLTVHAEMQLLAFYDHRPDLTPRLLFMGTSKKSCYLCHEFMSRHPLAIGVSASHQKLYPTWMPAPCSSSVRKKHKVILWEVSRHMEETVIRDLENRLGIRRAKQMDSTAGPSLTTTATVPSQDGEVRLPLRPASVKDQQGSASRAGSSSA